MYQAKTGLASLTVPALALTLAATGCGGPTGAGEDSSSLTSITAEHHHGGACQKSPLFKRTELGPNRYFFFQKVPMDPPVGKVWTTVRDFEKLVAIALPGIATDFQWVDGGGPGRAPASCQFVVSGSPIHEEVYALDNREHSLRYRLLVPALGLAAYDAEVRLQPSGKGDTTLSFTRDITFDAGVDPAGLTALIEQEGVAIQDYFCK